jgi:hypothetical protein
MLNWLVIGIGDITRKRALRAILSEPRSHLYAFPTHANVHYPAVENFVAAVLNGTPLACFGKEAIWTDWVTQQVKDKSVQERS